MPAAVLVVHDDQDVRELAVASLRAAFLEVAGFADPMAALNAIEASSRVRVLVTRVLFGPDKPHGVALALMVRVKRPGTKVVFVALEETEPYTEGLGVFLPMPLNPDILVATVSRLLVMQDDDGPRRRAADRAAVSLFSNCGTDRTDFVMTSWDVVTARPVWRRAGPIGGHSQHRMAQPV